MHEFSCINGITDPSVCLNTSTPSLVGSCIDHVKKKNALVGFQYLQCACVVEISGFDDIIGV